MQATRYYAAGILIGGFSKIGFGFLADRMKERTSLLLDYGLLTVSSLLILSLPSDTLIYPFVVIYGLSTAARDVVYPLVINHCFGERHMAEIYGAMLIALMPGGALGPIFAAAIHDNTGSYDTAFTVFAVMTTTMWSARIARLSSTRISSSRTDASA